MDDDDIQHSIADLIQAAADQKPIEFEKTFADLTLDRIQKAVNDKKIEIAKLMYGYEEPEEESGDVVEPDDQEEEELEDVENDGTETT